MPTDFASGVTSRGIPAEGGLSDLVVGGNIFWVDSVNGSDSYNGKKRNRAFATLRAAIADAGVEASNGDVILVAEGHSESLLTVLTISKAGLKIIGLGRGNIRPLFTVTGAVDGISYTAADQLLKNVRYATPSAAATANVNIAEARVTLEDVEFALGANAVDPITVTGAGEEPTFRRCKFAVSANGPDACVTVEGIIDRLLMEDCDILGSDGINPLDVGVIDYGGFAVTNPTIRRCHINGGGQALTLAGDAAAVTNPIYGPNYYGGSAVNGDNVATITATTLAADAIGASEIATGAIAADAFAAGAIDAAAIADAAIDAATFAAGAIDAAAIAAGAIDAATFAAGAVDAAAIADAAIDAATFAAGAIDAAAIAAGAIDAATFAAGAIDAAAIADAAIDAATFAAGAIDAAAIAAGAIDAGAFAAGAIDAAAIADAAIDAATFAAGAVDATALGADAITNAKIADNALAGEQFALSAGEKTTDGVVVTRATAALPQAAAAAIFTVTGAVLLKRLVGYVTVGIGAIANSTKLTGNSTGAGASTDLCTVLDINGHVADSRYEITGVFANAMVRTLDVPLALTQTVNVVIPPGTIDLDCAGSDGGGGRVRWSATYVPLEAGAQIVAA